MEMFRSFQTNKHVDVFCYLPIAVSSVTTGAAWRSGKYGATVRGTEVACHAALDRLTMQLIEDHVLSVLDLKLKKVVRRKKKTPPQPTCIRQTATADGARSILFLGTNTSKSRGLRLISHRRMRICCQRVYTRYISMIKPFSTRIVDTVCSAAAVKETLCVTSGAALGPFTLPRLTVCKQNTNHKYSRQKLFHREYLHISGQLG